MDEHETARIMGALFVLGSDASSVETAYAAGVDSGVRLARRDTELGLLVMEATESAGVQTGASLGSVMRTMDGATDELIDALRRARAG
jgi:hypothetical protein